MSKKIAYCTIASANYLARIQILDKSLKHYNPDAELHILLCEHPVLCNEISLKIERKIYSPNEIGCENWLQMAFYYNITEYNTALKPFFLEHLMNQGYDAIFYFDPDIEIFSSLKAMEGLIPEFDIVLTPHVCLPVPEDAKMPSMDAYIRAGQFNLGYIGISASQEARNLIRWWQTVCVEKCIFDVDHRYFVDQFWANIFPSFVGKIKILRDTNYNVAYWNIFQRDLALKNDKWYVDGEELKFFHFSGLAKENLTKVSIHQNRVLAPLGSDLYLLLSRYFGKIKQQEWNIFSDQSYSFGRYVNGELISDQERKNYLNLNKNERNSITNPFEVPGKIRGIIQIDLVHPSHQGDEQTIYDTINYLYRTVANKDKIFQSNLDIFKQYIDKKNRIISEKDRQLDNLNFMLAEKEQHLSNLNKSIIEKDQHLDHLNKIIIEKDGIIHSFSASKSWRITKPLRTFFNFFRNSSQN